MKKDLIRNADRCLCTVTLLYVDIIKQFQGGMEEPAGVVLPRRPDWPCDDPPRPVPLAVLHPGVLHAVRGGHIEDVPEGNSAVKEGEDDERGEIARIVRMCAISVARGENISFHVYSIL